MMRLNMLVRGVASTTAARGQNAISAAHGRSSTAGGCLIQSSTRFGSAACEYALLETRRGVIVGGFAKRVLSERLSQVGFGTVAQQPLFNLS